MQFIRIMQYDMPFYVVVFIMICCTLIEARPQDSRQFKPYNHADMVLAGGSHVEDNSEHLSYVAKAYKGTDQNYNDFPNRETLQPIPAVQVGKVMESPAKEVEHYDSAIMTFYENKHKQVNGIAPRIPVLDKTAEHEKYGNTGDRFLFLTQGIVNVMEGIANFINKSIQGSDQAAHKTIKIATDHLDQLGAKIVGL